ncbi:MAG: hypothetical protein ABF968_01640 [Acetobacter sp.]|uniref:hypothetical protein n=1 Tax=Acetobacter sp. TaxID=440 RepID=UPI0039EC8E02
MKRYTFMFWIGYGLVGMASLILCVEIWKSIFLGINLANETEAGLMGMGFGALGTGSGLCAAAFSLLARQQAASCQSVR